jgi:hypothetical protein
MLGKRNQGKEKVGFERGVLRGEILGGEGEEGMWENPGFT